MNYDELIIDKLNDTVAFNEDKHVYWDINTKQRFTSVTTLVGLFEQPYDSDFWASYKALEELAGDGFNVIKSTLLKTKKFIIDYIIAYEIAVEEFQAKKQEYLDRWSEKNRQSCERGTAYHLGQELSAYESNNDFIIDHINKHCEVPFGDFKVEKGNYNLMSYERYICPEYLAQYSKDGFYLAGQADVIIRDGKYVDVLDYKTNEKMDMKSYFDSRARKTQRMKFPLGKLDDCNYIHYCLQLSTYAYMIKLQTGLEPRNLVLIHHNHDGVDKIIPAKYLEKEVIAMLKQAVLAQKIKEEQERLIDLL